MHGLNVATVSAQTTLTAVASGGGGIGKDGFNGYESVTPRGALADPYFYKNTFCERISTAFGSVLVIRFSGNLPQSFFRVFESSMGNYETASADTFGFDTSTYWTWNLPGSTYLTTGSVIIRGD